jgi:colanic acid biosynthesis glycosyl transferase WcaI
VLPAYYEAISHRVSGAAYCSTRLPGSIAVGQQRARDSVSRFVIFTSAYWPEPIGSAVYMAEYAEALAAQGHRVTVVACYPYYPSWDRSVRQWRYTQEMRGGVRIIRVPHTVPSEANAIGRLGIEATYGIASAALLPWLGRIDATIGAVPALSGGLAALLAATLHRAPSGLMVRDFLSAAARHGGVPGSGEGIARALNLVERITMRCTRVSVIARGFAEQARALGARHVDYIPNYRTLGSPRRTAAEERARLGVPEGAMLAVYSGAIGYKQGWEFVIEAARQVGPGVQLLIVGDGHQREWLTDEVERLGVTNVRWLPLVAEEDYPDLLNAADVLLMPQRETEADMSVPGKITSYLAAGRPILAAASPHSETAKIVFESGGGVVVEPGDGVALGRALRAMLDDPAQRARYAAASLAYADRELDREAGIRRFVEWAEALAERREPQLW